MKLILLLFMTATFPLIAQENQRGVIGGLVSSEEDHQVLVGANVFLRGTVLGTSTDAHGRFFLRRIPTGEYALSVSLIGYERKIVRNIQIRDNETTNVAVELRPAAVQTDPVVITANKREQSLREVPVSVSVVDEQALSFRHTVTVDDALKYVPGVNITHSQVNIRGSTGYSHGVGTRVLLLVDGLPFLSGDTGEIIWESLPVGEIERVEVVKGAGSALYGSNALGGVINIISKSVGEQPETKLRLYGGEYQLPDYSSWHWTQDQRTLSGVQASHQQRIGDVSLSGGLSRTLDDGYKRNDFWKRWNGWARVGYDLSSVQSVGFSFSILDQRRGNFLYWKDFNHALEPQDNQLTERIQSLRWNLSGSYKQFLSNQAYYTVKASWYRSRWEDNLPSAFDSAGTRSQSDFIIGEAQTNVQISDQHILTAGISLTANRVSADTIFGTHSGHGAALYVQEEMNFPFNLQLTLGGRLDFQKLEDLESVSQFNPKLGLAYNPTSTTSLRASAGRGFRAPSIAEIYTTTEAGGIIILPNPSLKPERSWSFELGGSQRIGEQVSVDCALFRNELWDMIEPAFGSDGYVHFQNIIRARITGMEIALNMNLFNRFLLSQVSYTYMYPEDVTNSDILKYRPRHLLYLTNQFAFEPLRIGLDGRFISKTDRIDQEFVQLGIVPDGDKRVSIYVVDLRVGAEFFIGSTKISPTLHVNNLLQYYYADFIGNLGPTRNYVLTLEATL